MVRIIKVILITTILGIFCLGEATVFANEEVKLESASPYINEAYHCKIVLPDGWRVIAAPDQKVINLFKRLPLSYNGISKSAGITIKRYDNSTIYKSFNEVPNDQLQSLINESLQDLGKIGRAEGSSKDIGTRKVIWLEAFEEKRVLDSNVKIYFIMFFDDKYTWSVFTGKVPLEYSDAMNRELEQLIESFTTI